MDSGLLKLKTARKKISDIQTNCASLSIFNELFFPFIKSKESLNTCL
jgi:hypothetical protein